MTTKVTQLYSAWAAKLQDLFADKYELANPYNLELNPDLFIYDGYGISFGPGEPVESVGCCLTYERLITITLSKIIRSTKSDAQKRAQSSLDLMEEFARLTKEIEKDSTLDGAAFRSVYTGDGGIQTLFNTNGQEQAFFIQVNFMSRYSEDLT